MKKTFLTLSAVALIMLFWPSQGLGQSSTTTQKGRIFGSYLDHFITKCESKRVMRNSRCINIRRDVALSCLKAHFLEFHREDLIRSMIAKDIGTKPHQMHYYLNRKFFDTLRKAIKAVPSLKTANDPLL